MATEHRVETAREPRFPMAVPMVYRHAYQLEWHEGTTVNVSGTGALFMGPLGLWEGAPVELRLMLRDSAPGVAPGNFRCTGRITRIGSEAADPNAAMMAAQFEDFRFEHCLNAD